MKNTILKVLKNLAGSRFNYVSTPDEADEAAYSYDSLRGSSGSGPRYSAPGNQHSYSRTSPSEAPVEFEFCRS
jgi:hypothetical protein